MWITMRDDRIVVPILHSIEGTLYVRFRFKMLIITIIALTILCRSTLLLDIINLIYYNKITILLILQCI
jgi:hypothetical protein